MPLEYPPSHTPGGALGQLWKQFCEFECIEELFWKPLGGIPLWERIRVPVFHQLLGASGLMEPLAENQDHSMQGRLKALPSVMSSVFTKRPGRKVVDLLFVGHPRRKHHDDGTWWDLYCDPIINDVVEPAGWSYLLLERPYRNRHYTPPHTRNIGHLDAIAVQSAVKRKMRRSSLDKNEQAFLQQLELKLKQRFGLAIPVLNLAKRALALRHTQIDRYRALLKKLQPRLVCLVVSYGNETIIEACRNLGIATAELQHGNIDEVHPGYSFPRAGSFKSTFPDYYLAFGEYWREVAQLPIPRDNFIPIGFPYLEAAVKKYSGTPKRNRALFLSQESVGEKLSQCAAKIAQHIDHGFEIVYKLHPCEYENWQQRYPWLVDSGVKVIDDHLTSLHELMASSKLQVGVYSTALYEGLAFGLPTHIYELPTAAIMQRLVQRTPGVRFFRSVDQLAQQLARPVTPSSKELHSIFMPHSIDNARVAIEEILARADQVVTV